MVRQLSRIVIVVSDVAALTLCLSGALLLFNKEGSGTKSQAIWANVVLSLPLLVVVVVCFALNRSYANPRDRALKGPGASPVRAASPLGVLTLLTADSLIRLPYIMCDLGIGGCAVLVIDHLFGSLRGEATLEPLTLVVALLLAIVIVPTVRVVTRGAASLVGNLISH